MKTFNYNRGGERKTFKRYTREELEALKSQPSKSYYIHNFILTLPFCITTRVIELDMEATPTIAKLRRGITAGLKDLGEGELLESIRHISTEQQSKEED